MAYTATYYFINHSAINTVQLETTGKPFMLHYSIFFCTRLDMSMSLLHYITKLRKITYINNLLITLTVMVAL